MAGLPDPVLALAKFAEGLENATRQEKLDAIGEVVHEQYETLGQDILGSYAEGLVFLLAVDRINSMWIHILRDAEPGEFFRADTEMITLEGRRGVAAALALVSGDFPNEYLMQGDLIGRAMAADDGPLDPMDIVFNHLHAWIHVAKALAGILWDELEPERFEGYLDSARQSVVEAERDYDA